MRPLIPHGSRARRIAAWLAFIFLVTAIVQMYRFAEPKRLVQAPLARPVDSKSSIHLSNVPFVAYSGDRKAWSLWAGGVDIFHSAYNRSANIQSALITNIRDGVLYDAPEQSLSSTMSTSLQPAGLSGKVTAPEPVAGPVVLRFHANKGSYYVGEEHPLPGETGVNYRANWQLVLEGDVEINTRDKAALHTQSLTIMGLTNRKSQRQEQRIECDAGASIARSDVDIKANRLRYSLNDHMAEFLQGVHATHGNIQLQAEQCYWLMKENSLRVPDNAAGILDGKQFTAEHLEIDLKNDMYSAEHVRLIIPRDVAESTVGIGQPTKPGGSAR